MVLIGKGIETGEKASIFKTLCNFRPTPKPWVAGSNPPAPAKQKSPSQKRRAFLFGGIATEEDSKGSGSEWQHSVLSEPRLTEERSKAEIKNSALRCRDETESSCNYFFACFILYFFVESGNDERF